MTLEQRLARLERQNRWMKRIGTLALAGVALLSVMTLVRQAKGMEPTKLVAKSLAIHDSDGRVRIHVGKYDSHGWQHLDIYDEEGTTTRVSLDADALELLDRNAEARTRITVDGGVRVYDADLKVRASLDRHGLRLWDRHGTVRGAFSLAADGGPALTLSDKTGNARAALFTDDDGWPAVILFDETGKVRATLGVNKVVAELTGTAIQTAEDTLTLFNAKGNVIWQAPR